MPGMMGGGMGGMGGMGGNFIDSLHPQSVN